MVVLECDFTATAVTGCHGGSASRNVNYRLLVYILIYILIYFSRRYLCELVII